MTIPSSLRTNVLANAIGRFSSIILAVLCTPLYIHFIGIEAYGLIGFYITLQASISFLEMGLSRACSRELARHSGQGDVASQLTLDTLRSLEVIYWAVAILLGVVLFSASPWIASSWLNSTVYSTADIERIVAIIAWVIALRWPVGLYSGALMGLQRQVLMNTVQVVASVLNWAGSVVVLWLVDPDVLAFFQWQFFVAVFATALFVVFTWRAMPGSFIRGCFSLKAIKMIARFATGVGSNAILGTILFQADKIILSAILPLKQFGYYALASVIANMASMMAGPVSNAVFPRFSQLVGAKAPTTSISSLYHLASQAVAVLIVPFSLTIAFFSDAVLYVYTGSAVAAENTSAVLMVLIVAKMLHASMIVPYALQLAYGWVRLSLIINIASVLWLVPAIYLLTSIYGPLGAALAWLVVPIIYVSVGMPLMHQKLLAGELGRWLKRSMVIPIIAVGSFLSFVLWFSELPSDRWLQGVLLLIISITALVVMIFSTRDVNQWIRKEIINWRAC